MVIIEIRNHHIRNGKVRSDLDISKANHLHFKQCKNLKSLPKLPAGLQGLVISDCPSLTYLRNS